MRRRRLRFALFCLLGLLGLVSLGFQPIGDVSDAEYVTVQILDNGGFEETAHGAIGAHWLTATGRGRVELPADLVSMEQASSGDRSLSISSDGASVYQYIPCPAGTVDRLFLRTSILLGRGLRDGNAAGVLTVRDSARRELIYVIGENPRLPASGATKAYVGVAVPASSWIEVNLPVGEDFVRSFGVSAQPRLTLLLGRQAGSQAAVYWDDLAAEVPFPVVSEAELLDLILDEAAWVIDNLSARARDDIGEPSPYFVKTLDAVTGDVLSVHPAGGGGPVYNQMLAYLGRRDEPAYRNALIEMADAVLAHVNPVTGLQRRFDPETEKPIDATAIPAPMIDFLLRVYELTDDARYLQGAIGLGEAILELAPRLIENPRAAALTPNGFLPNKFNSATGDPIPPERTYEVHIRWLASAGALIHLYSATGREDFRNAALESALVYTNHDAVLDYWSKEYPLAPFSFEPVWYDWDLIDPAFDDYFGYGIGGRKGPYGILDIYERTGDDRLSSFLDESLSYMRAVWEEGILRGGYTFADDARSWQAYYDRYVVDPVAYASHKDVLIRNARNVFRSSQIGNGAWIDARFRLWNASFPDDQASCPRNLLAALTWAYLVDDRNPQWLAMICEVFRVTKATYKREYGYLRHPDGVQEGTNAGGIELRFLGELLNHLVPHLAIDSEAAGP